MWVGECFFCYRLTRVVLYKIQRAVKQLCVCVCICACMLMHVWFCCVTWVCSVLRKHLVGKMSLKWPILWSDVGMVISLGSGADLHMAQLMPLPLTVSCSSKSRLVLPSWFLPFCYPLTRVVPDKIQKIRKTIVHVCLCVLCHIFYMAGWMLFQATYIDMARISLVSVHLFVFLSFVPFCTHTDSPGGSIDVALLLCGLRYEGWHTFVCTDHP